MGDDTYFDKNKKEHISVKTPLAEFWADYKM
jgi:hypothetical protein